MKREFLKELGITDDEVIKKIMDENGNDINAEKAKAEAVTAERDNLKQQVADRDKQLSDLSKSKGNVEELQKQISDLQNENKTNTEKYEAEMKRVRIEAAVQVELQKAGAKNIKAVKALLDLEKAELTEDGSVKDLDKQIKNLSTSEDSKFYHYLKLHGSQTKENEG